MTRNDEAPQLVGGEASKGQGTSLGHDSLPITTPASERHRTTQTGPTGHFCALAMTELSRHVHAAGLSQEGFSEVCGLADRYFAKLLNAHAPSGREPTWATFDTMLSALMPDGYTVVITPIPGPARKQQIASFRRRFPRSTHPNCASPIDGAVGPRAAEGCAK